VTELDSIRIIARCVQIKGENLYLLVTLLFSQYLYVDLTRPHVSMVIGGAMAMSPQQRHREQESSETSHCGQVDSAAPSPA
jgi:hypothetical protein